MTLLKFLMYDLPSCLLFSEFNQLVGTIPTTLRLLENLEILSFGTYYPSVEIIFCMFFNIYEYIDIFLIVIIIDVAKRTMF